MKLTEEHKKQLETEIVFSATRSSGPGGQNVNKVNTRVELRFSVINSIIFSEEEKARISLKLKNRINSEGELIITSQTARTQLDNKEKALEKFFDLIEKALTIQKKRLKSRPTVASRLKRLESKKNLAQKKQLRKPPET
ncbi:MAG TPA: alternative ribosome rescue aminoacyl-tRNA hydrolase ArfB [Draconibacterium sp.]|jgi:ribosome-associated protein|nr:alternative ribosome rescue aminoacyl-tRNA hydrolase ArfB [Draconibacterium sp.]